MADSKDGLTPEVQREWDRRSDKLLEKQRISVERALDGSGVAYCMECNRPLGKIGAGQKIIPDMACPEGHTLPKI